MADNNIEDIDSAPSPEVTPHSNVKRALTEDELNQRKRRNRAIALMIIGFVVLVYLVTIMRLGASVAERSF